MGRKYKQNWDVASIDILRKWMKYSYPAPADFLREKVLKKKFLGDPANSSLKLCWNCGEIRANLVGYKKTKYFFLFFWTH